MMAGSVFQFGREVPVYILQHLILSFGGAYVLQDQVSDLSEKDQEIVYKKVTHIVMDRPMVAGQQTLPENKSKEFVQPQYIVDSVNNLILLPTRPYKPGVAAPAHLSPFGVESDGTQKGYMPDRQREINTLAGLSVTQAEEESSSEEEEEAKVEEVAVVSKKAAPK